MNHGDPAQYPVWPGMLPLHDGAFGKRRQGSHFRRAVSTTRTVSTILYYMKYSD